MFPVCVGSHLEGMAKKKMVQLLPLKVYLFILTLLHSERPKLGVLPF